mmetsp:Transcript_19444/g.48947  ORF Transcript_19444/g.48947 Transcript_19444/m.48947 type:complete len:235 (+) Transcript_19444:391-1095(+)
MEAAQTQRCGAQPVERGLQAGGPHALHRIQREDGVVLEALEDDGAVDLRLLILQQLRHVEDRVSQHVRHRVAPRVLPELLPIDQEHELALGRPCGKVADHAHACLPLELRRRLAVEVARIRRGELRELGHALESLVQIPLALPQSGKRRPLEPCCEIRAHGSSHARSELSQNGRLCILGRLVQLDLRNLARLRTQHVLTRLFHARSREGAVRGGLGCRDARRGVARRRGGTALL